MRRTTITVSDERRRAFEAEAVRRGITLSQLIDETLGLAGTSEQTGVAEILARARTRSGLSEKEAVSAALDADAEVRRERP